MVVAKSDGEIKKRLGATSHNHASVKDKILALIVEHEELSEALQNQGATGRSLVSDIATRLRENKLLPMMSSAIAVQSRFLRAKGKIANQSLLTKTTSETALSFPEFFESFIG